jgi:hypothetical protein
MEIYVSSPRMLRRSTKFCLGVLALLGAAPAAAQLNIEPSVWSAPHDGVKLHPDEAIDLHTTVEKPIDPYAYKRGLFKSLGLYEYKPAENVDGRYSRPHYAFGLHSDLMRDALSLTGLDAESCVAPIVRLRARQAAITGNTGVSMAVFARCTFR